MKKKIEKLRGKEKTQEKNFSCKCDEEGVLSVRGAKTYIVNAVYKWASRLSCAPGLAPC